MMHTLWDPYIYIYIWYMFIWLEFMANVAEKAIHGSYMFLWVLYFFVLVLFLTLPETNGLQLNMVRRWTSLFGAKGLFSGGGVIGDPVKFCTFRIFDCTACKFPFSPNARSGFLGWGWGWGGVQWHALYLHTCSMLLHLRTGSMLRNCTCAHVRCYAIVLAHMFDATQLHMRTYSMLRNCTCAHVRCYAIALIADMFDATQLHLRMWRYHLPANLNFQMKVGQLAKKSQSELNSWKRKPARVFLQPMNQHVKHNRMATWYKQNNGVIYHLVTYFQGRSVSW